jgi:6-phosphogluconolactonase
MTHFFAARPILGTKTWRILGAGLTFLLFACSPQPTARETDAQVVKQPSAPGATRVSSQQPGMQTTSTHSKENSPLVFVGSYTSPGHADGITVYRMDPNSGALTQVNKATSLPNPSFLTVDPSQRYLIAVSEAGEYNGQPGGAVSSYAINPTTGALKLINSQPTHGESPCYVSLDPAGKWVLVANYSSGSVTVLPLGEDGRLGAPSDVVQHSGSSVNPWRQESPHAHSILRAPGSETLTLAADLGIDRVMLYDLDPKTGKLVPHSIPWLSVKPGAGPRHMVFHPNQRFLYVVNELDSSVTSFAYDAGAGAFQELQTLSLLPEDFKGTNNSADIHITPSGKFLYASNRGHDSLAMFSIDDASGKLTPMGHVSTQGKTPRNFAIDPYGKFLLVANQDSGNIITLRIDPLTGKLSPTGQKTSLSAPVCIQFYDK